MRFYPRFFKVFFSGMEPEKAHHVGFSMVRLAEKTGASAVLRRMTAPDQSLERTVMGLTFPSPFGLAAGFDKEGHGTTALCDLGFGHIEVGTVTAIAQPGNPQPRLFRLVEDKALINRMGFNNPGAAAVAPRIRESLSHLSRRFGRTRPILGINIGKSKVVELEDAVSDYRTSAATLAPLADYMVVNVSSPNTPGLRLLQSVESLRPILEAVRDESESKAQRRVPLLVKIAPDLADEDIAEVAALAIELKLDGIIATNTTISREGLSTSSDAVESMGAGGLSGAPLKERSMQVLQQLRALLPESIAIISVGGVSDAEDVIDRLNAGADLVQAYTAFLYEGPFWAWRINAGLKKAQRAGRLARS
ncbi:quinone-dependent dihydroorotate dehydrogenase [Neomicrococcus aestuarii]|uniref:Dihydroorotate dehydrogenase (quinone) n=1 Tax=Neomicrococcus aestuarii TaxID=556325 RepID=A0A1L2ZLN2_9MICC|nr:quinone-dependent dihydroorotate dehydrogenase [Neomicrococcus aestuarii]APF40097.1 dihydroorotate dehydrogenase (quinone) [Neomicrococcus aestuarii]